LTEYKIVNLSYTEQASIVVRAKDNEEAEAAVWDEFPNIPDLQILSIEDAPPDVVEKVLATREARREEQERVLN
jgi:hypothetical protein